MTFPFEGTMNIRLELDTPYFTLEVTQNAPRQNFKNQSREIETYDTKT